VKSNSFNLLEGKRVDLIKLINKYQAANVNSCGLIEELNELNLAIEITSNLPT